MQLGVKLERRRGEGSEFESLREFVTGMDIRSLDWKSSARHRKLMARGLIIRLPDPSLDIDDDDPDDQPVPIKGEPLSETRQALQILSFYISPASIFAPPTDVYAAQPASTKQMTSAIVKSVAYQAVSSVVIGKKT